MPELQRHSKRIKTDENTLIILAADKTAEDTVNNQEIRAALDRHWEAVVALDLDRTHEIYHDDVVVEFLQSGERILGKQNIFEMRAHYPSKLTFKILRVRGEGNIWVTEYIITYDGGRPVNIVNIMEFRDGKVSRETLYFADPFEPPEWRSQWVERM
jgi:ketosteroid isomerase-like protein